MATCFREGEAAVALGAGDLFASTLRPARPQLPPPPYMERIDNVNTVRKRIFCITFSLLLASMSVFPLLSRTLMVHAASVPAVGDAEASAEAMMLLWDMLVNGMIIGGAGEMKADYDTEKGLFVAFMDRLSDVVLAGQPVLDDSVYELADGTRFSLSGLVGAYVDGTGALQIPDEETWSRYRVIEGGGGVEPPDPEEPEDPEPEKPDLFSKITAINIGNGFLAELGGFILDLWNGDVEGFTAQQVFGLPDYYYDPQNTGVAFSYKAGPYYNGSYFSGSSSALVSSHLYCIVSYSFETRYNAGYYDRVFYCYSLNLSGNGLKDAVLPNAYSGYTPMTGFGIYIFDNRPQVYSSTLPIFSSNEAALNYLKTGDDTDALNGLCYDFPGLINSVPEVLSPLIGIRLSPSAVPGLNAALSDAVATFPVAGLDPAENTQGYRDAVQGVVDDHAVPLPVPVPSPDPVPDPVPDLDPDPGPGPKPGDGSEDLEGYKRDLRRIFPFCVPFDLIHLIQVLTADPQAPVIRIPVKFEPLGIDTELVADLSIFDPLAALFRTGIRVLFILSLIMVSRDMVRG